MSSEKDQEFIEELEALYKSQPNGVEGEGELIIDKEYFDQMQNLLVGSVELVYKGQAHISNLTCVINTALLRLKESNNQQHGLIVLLFLSLAFNVLLFIKL